MDLGSCPKHHALALRADYEKALSRGKDYDYDLDAMEHLTNFIAGEVDYAWTQNLCFQETYYISSHIFGEIIPDVNCE